MKLSVKSIFLATGLLVSSGASAVEFFSQTYDLKPGDSSSSGIYSIGLDGNALNTILTATWTDPNTSDNITAYNLTEIIFEAGDGNTPGIFETPGSNTWKEEAMVKISFNGFSGDFNTLDPIEPPPEVGNGSAYQPLITSFTDFSSWTGLDSLVITDGTSLAFRFFETYWDNENEQRADAEYANLTITLIGDAVGSGVAIPSPAPFGLLLFGAALISLSDRKKTRH
jgi:hypothetical protein